MEEQNYYDILGVSKTASSEEITAAKNFLARRYHPDANMKDGLDTTSCMQDILRAYEVLSDAASRAAYDRTLAAGAAHTMQTFNLKEESPSKEQEDSFVIYWKAAGSLYEIILQSDALFHQGERTSHLTQLSMQALKYVIILRDASIPERYWHPDIMNWLLFTWYKNRNITITYLLTLYDDYMKRQVSAVKRLQLQHQSHRFQHSVKRLMKY